MDVVIESGLVITDRRRHLRASEQPQIDPREHVPNTNRNPMSPVGPESDPGDEMMPMPSLGRWHAESWDGWPEDWQTPYSGDAYSGSGYGRTLASRAGIAATCVDLNTRQLASFPVYGLRNAEPFNLPAWADNPEPVIYSSWVDFMHAATNSIEIRGEAFIYATGRYADGFPSRFVALNPDAVRIEWMNAGIEYLVDDVPIDSQDILHIKYQSWPGRLHGISPLEWSAGSVATSAALERYARNLSTRGGVPWAVLKANRNINRKQAQDAQNVWVESALRRDGAPAVLGTAFDLQPLSFSPEQMALLGLREFDDRRICAAFGVPGYLVNVSMGQGTTVTYANASQLFNHHWTATLRPLANLISRAMSRWLLPHGSKIEFNPERYVQPPLQERAVSYRILFNLQDPVTGRRAMELEEIRAAERLPAEANLADLVQAQRLTGGGA